MNSFGRFWKTLALPATAALAICASDVLGADAAFSWKKTKTGIEIRAGELVKRIDSYGKDTLRVTANLGEDYASAPSICVVAKPSHAAWKVAGETKNDVTFSVGSFRVTADKSNGALTFAKPDGSIILKEKDSVVEKRVISDAPTYEVKQTFTLKPDEAIYGLGQSIRPFLNYRGQEILIVQANVPAYTNVLASSGNYGILWDIASQSVFKDDADGMSIWSESAPSGVDYYLMTGNDLDGVIGEYRMLTGAAPMFPKQAFGFFMSKERYRTQQEVIDIVETFRKNNYPIDYIVQDWQYWKAEPGKWTSMTWCPERYPDPKAMCDTLHNKLHVKIMTSIWPTVGSDCDLARELDAKNLRFKPLHWISKNARVYDAYSQEGRDIYFKHMKKGLFDVGVDAMWMDGTEVETRSACHDQRAMIRDIKENGVNAMGDFTRYLNSYSLMTNKGCYEGQRKTRKQRVLTLTRSAWGGQQRYAAIPWSGDTFSSWNRLKEDVVGGLQASLSGLPYWTQDTGGFFVTYPNGAKNPEYQELLARWNQFSIFNPIYRWHGTSIDREPWRFKDLNAEVYDSFLKTANLRYRLIPYIYSLAWQTTKNAYTMTRPLVMDFPNEEGVKNCADKFMFGPAFLVQPITRPMFQVPELKASVIPENCLTTPDGKPGVKIEYFSGCNFDKFASAAVDKKVDYTWPGPPLIEWPAGLKDGNNFSCRIAGVLTIPESGEYEIGVSGDDGYRLWLNGEKVVEDWGAEAERYAGKSMTLKKGQKIPFKIEYYQGGGKRALKFAWKTPADFQKQREQLAALNRSESTKLPAGADWFDFWTNAFHRGGETVAQEYPLDKFPLFVRAGSIVPMAPQGLQYATEETDKPYEIRVYSGKDAAFTLYEDDGETYAYEKGKYAETPLVWNEKERTFRFGKRKGGFPEMRKSRTYQVVVINPDGTVQKKKATYGGKALEATFR